MKKILIVEWCCSGLGGDPALLPMSLVREGKTMLLALMDSLNHAKDFSAKTVLHPNLTSTFPSELSISPFPGWAELARSFDLLWPIAPETDGILLGLAQKSREAFQTVLIPNDDLIALATDKLQTFHHLKRHGLPTPETFPIESFQAGGGTFQVIGGTFQVIDGTSPPGPWVLKLRDGAGSQGMRLIVQPAELMGLEENRWILQTHIQGTAVSQAILGGPAGPWFCPPCIQQMSKDGSFAYQGGSTPISSDFARRTQHLTERLVKTLPPWLGWLGVDMILGDAVDVILEINPRLTTSFVGLNRAAGGSLAPAIIRHAFGENAVMPRFSAGPIEFDASGNTTEP